MTMIREVAFPQVLEFVEDSPLSEEDKHLLFFAWLYDNGYMDE